jgi:hypothetical protein
MTQCVKIFILDKSLRANSGLILAKISMFDQLSLEEVENISRLFPESLCKYWHGRLWCQEVCIVRR